MKLILLPLITLSLYAHNNPHHMEISESYDKIKAELAAETACKCDLENQKEVKKESELDSK